MDAKPELLPQGGSLFSIAGVLNSLATAKNAIIEAGVSNTHDLETRVDKLVAAMDKIVGILEGLREAIAGMQRFDLGSLVGPITKSLLEEIKPHIDTLAGMVPKKLPVPVPGAPAGGHSDYPEFAERYKAALERLKQAEDERRKTTALAKALADIVGPDFETKLANAGATAES